MRNWAPIWSGLVDSSIWEEEDHVFRVFIAMLALKDSGHVVSGDSYKLARRIHMSTGKVLDALRVLSEPDQRRPGQQFDGRRIEATEDGWLVLNGDKYTEMMQQEMKRARWRRGQAARRERVKNANPLPGETNYLKGQEKGEDWTPHEFREEPPPYGVQKSSVHDATGDNGQEQDCQGQP